MTSVQKAILPGILGAILLIILITSLIALPQPVLASTGEPPHTASQPSAAGLVQNANPPDLQPMTSLIAKRQGAAAQQEQAAALGNSSAGCAMDPAIPEQVRQWCPQIDQYAAQNNLDPILVAALITQESNGDPNAVSGSGAVGLMQVMPSDGAAASFMCVAGPCFSDRPTMNQLYDATFNIQFGTQYLESLVQRNGSLREALRAYGPSDRGYEYADIVLSIYQSYQ